MSPLDTILSRVKKLLALAGNNENAQEAAAAASRAQALIDEHHLSDALLAIDSASPVAGLDDEPIINFGKAGAPLDVQKQLDRWRSSLAVILSRYNACEIWANGGTLHIVGRPSDAETVRYLYAYLTRETERLTTQLGQGMGRTWRNNCRLGVVDAIRTNLKTQHDTFTREARQTTGMVLVRINSALLRVEERRESVVEFLKSDMKLRRGNSSRTTYDADARDKGRRAGATIAMGGGKPLTSGAKALNS